MTYPSWRDHAACTAHQDLFATTINRDTFARRHLPTPIERAALAVCDTCPVQQECLANEMALIRSTSKLLSLGVVGGTTRTQRLQAKEYSPRKPIEHGTLAGWNRHKRFPDVFGLACEPCLQAKRDVSAAHKAAQRTKEKA